MTKTPDRLYIAVRADLPPGLQAAQAVHAAFEFQDDFPEETRDWYYSSNYLVIVAVPDEDALHDLRRRAAARGIRYAYVREPDLGNQHTAITLGPGPAAKKLCANLPSALREPAMT